MSQEPGDFLEQVQQMMSALSDAQADLDQVEVDGTAGGGTVRVVANGVPVLKRVEISPDVLDDPGLLGDLIVVAVNDALRKASDAARDRLGGLAGGLLPPEEDG